MILLLFFVLKANERKIAVAATALVDLQVPLISAVILLMFDQSLLLNVKVEAYNLAMATK